jgi:thiol-disulfide isomerase/thioredoxin
MRLHQLLGLATLCAAALVSAPAGAQTIQVGALAPEIDAARWYNVDGDAPSLASLRGRAVLIEFWAPWCGPCRAAWPHLEETERAWRERGLVVLALTDEIPEIVEPYLKSTRLALTVGAATTARQRYGVRAFPTTVLVGPDGRVTWVGHPKGLTADVLERAGVGVDATGFGPLALKAEDELAGRAGEAAAAAARGELGAALSIVARALAADGEDAAGAAERADLATLAARIDAHVDGLVARARRLAGERELVRAQELASALCEELGLHPAAEAPCALAAELAQDPATQRAVEAQRLLDEALLVVQKRGMGRARSLLEAIVRDHPGPPAADVARRRLAAR